MSLDETDSYNKEGDVLLSYHLSSLDNVAQKDVLINIDLCKSYFSKLIFDHPLEKINCSNKIDELCASFLPVLFEGIQADEDKLESLKNEISKQQLRPHFLVTQKRLDAIKAYFTGNPAACMDLLNEALEIAKLESLPHWLIKDILIDLRNQDWILRESQNCYVMNHKYQMELENDNSLLYYPLIDRFSSYFFEQLTEDCIKHKFQSPYTITVGHNLTTYVNFLAGAYVLALYNGSLTHLRGLYGKIMKLSFYCAEKFSDWDSKMLLLKTSIVNYNTKEIDNIINYFSDMRSKLNAVDAYGIYHFANNIPILSMRFCAKLEAFRVVGYFLDDDQFAEAWDEIYDLIIDWIEDNEAPIAVGSHIFAALEGTHFRINQEQLVEIMWKCCERRKRKFYNELFKLISKSIKLKYLSDESKKRLFALVTEIIRDDKERKAVYDCEPALIRLRRQDKQLSKGLDIAVSEKMPNFYTGAYRLATTEDKTTDMPLFVNQYVKQIIKRNETQGEGGRFSGYADQPHKIIKSIFQLSDVAFPNHLLNLAFKVSYETLLKKNQAIETKMDAIDLMVFIMRAFPDVLECDEISKQITKNQEVIETGSAILTNFNESNLRLWALLLYSCLGEDVSTKLIELLADVGDDTLSQINASQAFRYYLEASEQALDPQLESIFLQNCIKWCASPNLDVRWHAVKILYLLLRNVENQDIICNQLVKLIDTDNV